MVTAVGRVVYETFHFIDGGNGDGTDKYKVKETTAL